MNFKSQRKKYSKKHHYLPVFYLKDFADSTGVIHIYDKIEDTILTKQKPESQFYGKHLNNYKFNGVIKFTLEESFFTPMDSRGSELFNKIRSSQPHDLTALEKFELVGFIKVLFWRSPESTKHFVDIIKREGLSNEYFGFFKKGQDDFISDSELSEIKSQFLNDTELQKIFKHIVPMSDGSLEEDYNLSDKWHLFSLTGKSSKMITGDQPFLINNDCMRLNNVFNELLFPVGKSRLLSLSHETPCFLDLNLLNCVNLSILHQSKRFIASDNVDQLKELLSHYNRLAKLNLDKDLVKNTFELMHCHSKFKDHQEYSKAYEAGKQSYFPN